MMTINELIQEIVDHFGVTDDVTVLHFKITAKAPHSTGTIEGPDNRMGDREAREEELCNAIPLRWRLR